MLDLALLGHVGQPECRLCANGADDLETVRAAFEAACQCAEAISTRTAGNWLLQTDDNVGARRPVANAKRGRPIHMLLRRVAGGAEFHGKVQAAHIVAENKPLV